MFVKENSFRKLDDPFNDSTKKYVFYVKLGMFLKVFRWQQTRETKDLHLVWLKQ